MTVENVPTNMRLDSLTCFYRKAFNDNIQLFSLFQTFTQNKCTIHPSSIHVGGSNPGTSKTRVGSGLAFILSLYFRDPVGTVRGVYDVHTQNIVYEFQSPQNANAEYCFMLEFSKNNSLLCKIS